LEENNMVIRELNDYVLCQKGNCKDCKRKFIIPVPQLTGCLIKKEPTKDDSKPSNKLAEAKVFYAKNGMFNLSQ